MHAPNTGTTGWGVGQARCPMLDDGEGIEEKCWHVAIPPTALFAGRMQHNVGSPFSPDRKKTNRVYLCRVRSAHTF